MRRKRRAEDLAWKLAREAVQPRNPTEARFGVYGDVAAARVMLADAPAEVKEAACALLLKWWSFES